MIILTFSDIIPYNDDQNTFCVCNVADLPVVFPQEPLCHKSFCAASLRLSSLSLIICALQLIEEQLV